MLLAWGVGGVGDRLTKDHVGLGPDNAFVGVPPHIPLKKAFLFLLYICRNSAGKGESSSL